MGTCLLCKEREATQKGSHVIPSFFMKRINSIDGCNKRDHELGFSFGDGIVETYFGRDVYEDRRREYTDDECRIDDRTNLDTMDNVFCPDCEKLFSNLENKYSQTYLLSFNNDLVENTKLTGAEASLFWYSVIWRISATGHFNVKLNPVFEEKLRRIVLSGEVKEQDLYYAIFYVKEYRKNNSTFALFDCSDQVALLIVDEFMIVLFDGAEATNNNDVLWGMNFKCEVSNLNDGSKFEKIGLLPVQLFKLINDMILHQVVKRIDFRGKFNKMHLGLFGNEMPDYVFQEIMAEVQKAKLADKYTVYNYSRAFKQVIQNHPNLYRIRFVD